MKVSPTKIVAAASGLALSLGAGVGVASAQPGVDSIVHTTCSYSQVMAALDAHSPALADEFSGQPFAQSMLRQFLASPVDERQQIAQQAMATDVGQQYFGSVMHVASTCSSF